MRTPQNYAHRQTAFLLLVVGALSAFTCFFGTRASARLRARTAQAQVSHNTLSNGAAPAWLRSSTGTASTRLLTATEGQLLISEFRVRGPNGANDEFIEIYNNSGADHTVASISGTGYGVAASDGTTRCSIPNGTVLPNKGHYLCVNSVGYSLASYPAGNGTTATGDATYATDIPDNAGIALFNNNTGGASYSLANRLDAVGSTSEANVIYKEGTGYPAITPFSIDYSFYRTVPGVTGIITGVSVATGTNPVDTNNNATDFIFVDTNGTSAGAGQRLGAPGPQNLSSPVTTGGFTRALLDPCVAAGSPPNKVRDFTSDPPNNSTFGTIDLRRTFTNNTGGNVTRLRFRILDLTTFPAPSGIADLRPRTSSAVVVTVDRAPCGAGTSNVTVQGTTLEQPPSQPNGGGFNSSLSAGTITLATPLANGASVDLRFLFGIQQTGFYRLGIALEGLPGGGDLWVLCGQTDSPSDIEGGCNPPSLIISEFRLRGPNGANDEFVELYNNSDNPGVVFASDGSGGYALAASDGTARFTVPNGTLIPARGYFLGVNSVGYSLASYPAGNGTTATGNATYTTDIPDNAGIALFNTATAANFTLANRLDAVGSSSEANVLYKEGTGYAALTPFSIDYSFYRRVPGVTGIITGTSVATGTNPVDANDNAADFIFVDTNGTSAGAGQRLGAPGPQNLSSPVTNGATFARTLLDPCVAAGSPPNKVRDVTSDPANNSTFGTIDLRRTFTNNTGGDVTRLRFRVQDLTTFPAPSGVADLRPRTSSAVVVTVDRAPCGAGTSNVTVQGTTLEQPPPQFNGGGFNSSLSAGTITLGTPLANGASVDVRFLFGIQQTGFYRLGITLEALPTGGDLWVLCGHTESASDVEGGCSAPPTITCPANITENVTPGLCSKVVNYPVPASTGVPAPTVTCSPISGTSFNVGTTIVTCTAMNGVLPDASCNFTVTVVDNQAPTVNVPANITTNAANGACAATVSFTATATDNCLGATVTCMPASNSSFPIGTTTVSCKAMDAAGNMSAPSAFTVTVNEMQPPTITCPANITAGTTGTTQTVSYPAPTVTDTCPGVGAPLCTPASGSSFNVGVTTVNCTVKDAANNMAACSFTVTVNKVSGAAFDPLVCTGPGNTVQATLVMTNNGNVNQTVSDTTTFTNLVGVPNTCVATPNLGTCTVTNGGLTYNNATLAPGQTVTLTYLTQVSDQAPPAAQVCTNNSVSFSGGPALNFSVCDVVDCPPAGPGVLPNAQNQLSDQKPGSVLLYPIFTSDGANAAAQNTRLSFTNTHMTRAVFVHLFFVDGTSCSVADGFMCLTPNQTATVLAVDLDPGTTGYLVAVATDRSGCPINFNYLIGDEFVKFTSGHAANLGAESSAAIAGGLPACTANSVEAQLKFDGLSYNALPRTLAASNLPSRGDGNDTLLIVDRIGGHLGTGAATIGTLIGVLYDDAEHPFSFSLAAPACQSRGSLTNDRPRTTPRYDQLIPPGRTGWLKIYGGTDVGIIGAQINRNAQALTNANAFNQGHNLHKLTLTTTASVTIPVFPPTC